MSVDSSLREELETALKERWEACGQPTLCVHSFWADDCASCCEREALWAVEPVCEALLAAARADERERLIFALGSLDGKDPDEAGVTLSQSEATAWARGHDAGVEAAAALVRSAGVEPKEQQT